MDVNVSENVQRTRNYTVTGVDDTEAAVALVQSIVPGEALPAGVTLQEEGQYDSAQYSTTIP